MQYVALGTSDLRVSRFALGCMAFGSSEWRNWVLPEEQSRPILQRAFDAGINFFDTADMYSDGLSEDILGRAVRAFTRRDQVVIATKVFYPTGEEPDDRGLSRKHIMLAIERSLRRLNTDYVDLYIVHRWDRETPLEETLSTLDEVVRAGKVRYLGASSMYAWQFMRALRLQDQYGWSRFVSMQNLYNLAYREEENEMLPLCRQERIAVTPWGPLAAGMLARPAESTRRATLRARTDPFARELYDPGTDREIVARCNDVARERNVSSAQIALAWLLHKPEVTAPILGATQPGQLMDCLGAVDVKLSPEEMWRLEEPYRQHPIVGHE
jgi:aryl-alcohol dehydrogenase-like predicted oxidoreductase